MIQDILTFSRVGREEIEMEKVDCNQIVTEVLSEFEAVIAEKTPASPAAICPRWTPAPRSCACCCRT